MISGTRHGVSGLQAQKVDGVYYKKQKTKALFQFCLYPKPFLFDPRPIGWGKQNEIKAKQEYLIHMVKQGHYGIEATPAGFVAHTHKCWLGVSPNAWVNDPSVTDCQGIAEYKYPYSKAFDSPKKACKEVDFYCSIVHDKLHLKRTHAYYHQVQLQLYVTSDMQC